MSIPCLPNFLNSLRLQEILHHHSPRLQYTSLKGIDPYRGSLHIYPLLPLSSLLHLFKPGPWFTEICPTLSLTISGLHCPLPVPQSGHLSVSPQVRLRLQMWRARRHRNTEPGVWSVVTREGERAAGDQSEARNAGPWPIRGQQPGRDGKAEAEGPPINPSPGLFIWLTFQDINPLSGR